MPGDSSSFLLPRQALGISKEQTGSPSSPCHHILCRVSWLWHSMGESILTLLNFFLALCLQLWPAATRRRWCFRFMNHLLI